MQLLLFVSTTYFRLESTRNIGAMHVASSTIALLGYCLIWMDGGMMDAMQSYWSPFISSVEPLRNVCKLLDNIQR
jgi:hypothetical protein